MHVISIRVMSRRGLRLNSTGLGAEQTDPAMVSKHSCPKPRQRFADNPVYLVTASICMLATTYPRSLSIRELEAKGRLALTWCPARLQAPDVGEATHFLDSYDFESQGPNALRKCLQIGKPRRGLVNV